MSMNYRRISFGHNGRSEYSDYPEGHAPYLPPRTHPDGYKGGDLEKSIPCTICSRLFVRSRTGLNNDRVLCYKCLPLTEAER